MWGGANTSTFSWQSYINIVPHNRSGTAFQATGSINSDERFEKIIKDSNQYQPFTKTSSKNLSKYRRHCEQARSGLCYFQDKEQLTNMMGIAEPVVPLKHVPVPRLPERKYVCVHTNLCAIGCPYRVPCFCIHT